MQRTQHEGRGVIKDKNDIFTPWRGPFRGLHVRVARARAIGSCQRGRPPRALTDIERRERGPRRGRGDRPPRPGVVPARSGATRALSGSWSGCMPRPVRGYIWAHPFSPRGRAALPTPVFFECNNEKYLASTHRRQRDT